MAIINKIDEGALDWADDFLVTDSTGGSLPVHVDDWWMGADGTLIIRGRLVERPLIVIGRYIGVTTWNGHHFPEVEMYTNYEIVRRYIPTPAAE